MTDVASPAERAQARPRWWARPLAHGTLVLAGYLLLAVIATYPLATRARNHVFGLGTPPLNVWAMGWVLHQLPRDPLHLFDGNAFYPYSDSLAFSEHLFVPSLLAAPVVAVTGNLVLAHNAVILVTLALAGLGMYLLAFELTGHRAAAFAAGVLYAFHTWNVNELIRLQVLSNEWFPFLLLALIRYFARPTWRRALAAGLFYALQALSCMYWALYAPFLTAVALLALEWRQRLSWRRLIPLGLGLAAALGVTVPFLLPYVATARSWGFGRSMPDSIGLARYLSVLPWNWIYGRLLPHASPNADAAHFLGVSALALAVWGLARGRWREGSGLGRAFCATLAVAGFLLSLGPVIRTDSATLAPGPYRLLYEWAPGFRNVRYPERFSVFVALGLALLVAAGLARLCGRRPAWALAGAGVLFIEHLSVPLPLVPLPAGDEIPAVYRWMARQADIKVVAEVPNGRYLTERTDGFPMYYSTVHWKRTVQGFTGYFPPTYNFTRWRLHHFPAPESLAFLDGFGVDTLIVRDPSGEACRPERWPHVDGPFPDGSCVVRQSPSGRLLAPPGEPDPSLVEVDRRGFVAAASHPGAERAIDGDESTVWSTLDAPEERETFRLSFAEPIDVARVSLAIPPPFEFPTGLRLVGERPDGSRSEIPFDEQASYDRLFRLLLFRPSAATLDLDLPDTRLSGLALRVHAADSFLMPWTMSEIRIFRHTRPAR